MNLEGLIPIAGGVYGLLLAYGVIRAGKDADRIDAWHRRFGTPLKVLSPLVILFGLALLFRRL